MPRTVLFFVFFWTSIVLATPVCLAGLALRAFGLHGPASRIVHPFVRLWARACLGVAGTRVVVSGLERVPRTGGLCFVGNHQGTFDILVALACFPRPLGFITKSEAAVIPFLNAWIAAIGSVFIDRKRPARALRSIRRAAGRISSGAVVAIYPEGTRSRGSKMGEFRSGALKLAIMSGRPIVPVTIDGSYRTWEASKRIVPTEIRFVIHDPVATGGLGVEARKGLAGRIRETIGSALGS